MNFFGVAPTKVLVFRNGIAQLIDDAEPEDGPTSPDMLPKFKIIMPGMDDSMAPKGTWKDSATGMVVDMPSGTPNMKELLQQGRERWWDEYTPTKTDPARNFLSLCPKPVG